MDGNVAKGDDVRPFNKVSGQAGGGFANDDELLQDGALDEFVLHEGGLCGSSQKSLNRIAGIQDVL
jgi:hypothetical protein